VSVARGVAAASVVTCAGTRAGSRLGECSPCRLPVPGCSRHMEERPMTYHPRRSSGKPRVSPTRPHRVNPHVPGIDCGAAEHLVAVPPDRDGTPVRSFQTFTGDLVRLAEWLTACRVQSVAMEATGVYWIPIYEILETRGFQVLLVNARHLKNVP